MSKTTKIQSSLRIRPLLESDVHELRALAILTYRETYKWSLTSDEIEQRIRTKHSADVFLELLKDPENLFLGVFEDQELVGYLHLSMSGKSESVSTTNLMQLSRIYVHPNFKRKGIGRLLMRRAEAFALERGLQGLWLHCFDQNPESIRFYENEGYRCVGKDPFEILTGPKRFDVVMVKKLNE